jgi:hypothetical protein
MSTWIVQVLIVALFALTCGVLAAAWVRGRLGAVALVLFVVALIVWVAAFAAITNEFHGANNFATCDDQCGTVQYVSAVAFIAPPLLIAVAALAMLIARGQRWRARRAVAHENRA